MEKVNVWNRVYLVVFWTILSIVVFNAISNVYNASKRELVLDTLVTAPPSKDFPFKKIHLVNHYKINNATNKKYLDTIVSVGLVELSLTDVYVTLVPLPFNMRAEFALSGIELAALIEEVSFDHYIIFIDTNRTKAQHIFTLSHELIHLRDLYNNDLIASYQSDVVIYRDRIYEVPITYKSRPWEIEAKNEGFKLSLDITYELLNDNQVYGKKENVSN